MSRIARHGRKSAENRARIRRFQPACAAAGALALTLALAPDAQAQSRSGITVNSDVLNSLGPGPAAAPLAPLAPDAPATPLSPRSSDGAASAGQAFQAQPYQAQPYQAPAYPPAGGSSGPAFQPYGGSNVVVTRPGTLLFPPLEPPTSTLTPGFQDNHAARTEAMTNAFAEGPEPSSQLLIPLDDGGAAPAGNSGGDSVVVFMDNLPPVDDSAAAADAPRLTLRRPPMAAPEPAARKPEVSPEMLAEVGVTTVDDSAATLAPEFQAAEAEETPEAAPLTEVETVAIESDPLPAPAEAPAAEAVSEPTPQVAAVSSAEIAPPQEPTADAVSEPATDGPVSLLPTESAEPAKPADMTANDMPANESAEEPAAPVSSAEVAAPVDSSPAAPAMEDSAAQPAPGVQTASLTVGSPLEDMTVTFDNDSAELTDLVQDELRSLADSLRTNQDGRIQVLGFASAKDGSQDLARKLALSRALKVRTFLIDAGVPSTRIQVRSLGDQSGAGPANRVDIRPIDS